MLNRRGVNRIDWSKVTTTLPADITKDDQKSLVTLGFVLGPKTGDEQKFIKAIFPDGWKLVRIDAFSHLVDNKGRKRGIVYINISPWQKNAWLSLQRRFSVSFDTIGIKFVGIVKDQEVEILRTQTRIVLSKTRTDAKEWLDKNKPFWQNTLAYWEE